MIEWDYVSGSGSLRVGKLRLREGDANKKYWNITYIVELLYQSVQMYKRLPNLQDRK